MAEPKAFNPNRAFKRDYDRLFKENPETANLLLLMCEIADAKGVVEFNEDELITLFNARFNNPSEYSL